MICKLLVALSLTILGALLSPLYPGWSRVPSGTLLLPLHSVSEGAVTIKVEVLPDWELPRCPQVVPGSGAELTSALALALQVLPCAMWLVFRGP